jgi:hypothetical protein
MLLIFLLNITHRLTADATDLLFTHRLTAEATDLFILRVA